METIDQNEETRDVEMYIGYTNKTWSTAFVKIPRNTEESKVGDIAVYTAIELFYDNPEIEGEIAFIEVYNIPEIEQSGDK